MTDDGGLEEILDIELRPAAEVAARSIIIATMLRRLTLDLSPAHDAAGEVFDLREWLKAEGLWQQAMQDERAFLIRPANSANDDIDVDAALLAEDLKILDWALSPDRPLEEERTPNLVELLNDIPGPWDKTAPWVTARALKPLEVIAFLRERTEIWHWRLEVEPMRREMSGRDLMDLERTIRDVTRDGVSSGLLEGGKQGGFTLDGKPIAAAEITAVDDLLYLLEERLHVLNWLCGYGDDWDSVPLDI